MKTSLLTQCICFGLGLLLCAACSSGSSSGSPQPLGDSDAQDVADTLDSPDTLNDGEESVPADVDRDLDATESADSVEAEETREMDADVVEADPADEDSLDVAESEEEVEVEAPPVFTCQAEDSLFTNFTIRDEPRFSADLYTHDGTLANRCAVDGYLFAGAQGMDVTIRLKSRHTATPLVGRLAILDIGQLTGRRTGESFYDITGLSEFTVFEHSFTLPYTGEYVIAVAAKNYEAAGDYTVEAQCTANCDAKKFTRFPIVLMHGMAGFDKALGLLNYFNGVPDDLTEQGYVVYVTQAAMFNDSVARAGEIEQQLMDVLAETGARKLNLLVHSQGGLDARHFISAMGHGDVVASLTMVATPNRGTIVGDIVAGNLPGWSQTAIYAVVDFFANLLEANENDTREALKQVSVDYLQNEFNPAHPDDPRVQYYSYAGITCNLLEFDCRDAHSDERVLTAMMPTYTMIRDAGSDSDIGCGTNDGMVPLNSAMWGTFLGTVDADHADEIGQMKTGDFDQIAFYRNAVQYMVGENF